ncbi:MAG: trypsin-like peptidase domain-containing protein [Bacteroidales bacterium]|nr:trypsin-like peptidase domain-containing protein [Bacteroidales bacterium]
MRKTHLSILAVCLIAVTILSGCGSRVHKITGTKGTVKEIINGNTIKLSTGLRVELLGIAPNHESTSTYMESINLVGQKVLLVADKQAKKQDYKKATEKVRAYVFILPENVCLNGQILRQCARADNTVYTEANMKDSIENWRVLFKGCNHEGNIPDIALYMKQRTFLVQTPEGMGTGFFIGSNGLALTNNHVLPPHYESSAVIYTYGKSADDSNSENQRKIKRVIYSSPLEDKDITIFQVDLNDGETVPYFHLSKVQAPVGSHIQTFGNPSDKSGIMYTANYTQGTIGSYKTDDLHGRPNTHIVVYDIATNPGNSGGPVALDNGIVIAVHDMGSNAGEGINAGINILQVREMLDQLKLDYECK